jgi:hypothetical protein
MCEDSICFEQSMPYTWKKMGVLWRVLKFMMPIMKRIVWWTSKLNLLKDLPTNSLDLFFLNLTLIFALPLTLIYL